MEAEEDVGHRDDVTVFFLRLGEIEVGQPDGVHAAVVEKDRLVHAVDSHTRVSPLLPEVETGRHLLKANTQCGESSVVILVSGAAGTAECFAFDH